MSRDSEFLEIPLTQLEPKFTEFTGTKGVLRVLQPKDPRERATGMVFLCPHCKDHKTRRHNLIFLFDDFRVPAEARPAGRFSIVKQTAAEKGLGEFQRLTLYPVALTDERLVLRPQDVCGWTGTLIGGVVRCKKRRKKLSEWVYGHHRW